MITSTRECVAHNDLSVMILQNTAKIWHILSCLLYSTYSSILILSILGTNDHWHERVCRVYWPLTLTHIFQPFRYEFAIKLLKYGTSCRVRSTACTVLDGCFPSLAQMITSMRGCVVWPWSLSSRSFIHDFVIKLLKYGTSCCFRFTAHKVLDEFSHIRHKWSPAWEGVAYNDLWPWPISSRLFSCDVVYIMDYIHMRHKYSPWGDDVLCTISRSIG